MLLVLLFLGDGTTALTGSIVAWPTTCSTASTRGTVARALLFGSVAQITSCIGDMSALYSRTYCALLTFSDTRWSARVHLCWCLVHFSRVKALHLTGGTNTPKTQIQLRLVMLHHMVMTLINCRDIKRMYIHPLVMMALSVLVMVTLAKVGLLEGMVEVVRLVVAVIRVFVAVKRT